jgi:four helix bundle protein
MSLASLRCYCASLQLATEVHALVKRWSNIDRDTLGKQMIRAADSVALNIAEGYGRTGPGERLHSLLIADGSCQEVIAQLQLAALRGLIDQEELQRQSNNAKSTSIQMFAFARYVLTQHPEYQGRCRKIIEKRTAWMNKK